MIHLERSFVGSGRSERESPLFWKMNGQAFVIQGCRDELVRRHLPKFFPRAKFSSLTRKLYRWQFRQIVSLPNGGGGTSSSTLGKGSTTASSHERPLVFSHPFFQRDNPELMAFMESITAASTRRKEGTATRRTSSSTVGDDSEIKPELFTSRQQPTLSREGAHKGDISNHHEIPQRQSWSGQEVAQPNLQLSNRQELSLPPMVPSDSAYLSLLSSQILQNLQSQQQQQDGALQLMGLGGMTSTVLGHAMPAQPSISFSQLAAMSSLLSLQRMAANLNMEPNLVTLATLLHSSLTNPSSSSSSSLPSLSAGTTATTSNEIRDACDGPLPNEHSNESSTHTRKDT